MLKICCIKEENWAKYTVMSCHVCRLATTWNEHFELLAGVAERLPTAMLLGGDVPRLSDLLEKGQTEIALVVRTRAAAKRRAKENTEQAGKDESPQPRTTALLQDACDQDGDTETDEQNDELVGADFDNELFVGGGKSHPSRR